MTLSADGGRFWIAGTATGCPSAATWNVGRPLMFASVIALTALVLNITVVFGSFWRTASTVATVTAGGATNTAVES